MAGTRTTEIHADNRVLEWKISCPACGGGITLHDGSRILHCAFCGERHLRNRAHVMALEVDFQAHSDTVAGNIKRWLRSNGHRATSMGEPMRLLVPYWRTTGKRLFWTRASEGETEENAPETRIVRTIEVRPAFDGAESFPTDDELPTNFGHAVPFDSRAVSDQVLVARPAEDLPFGIGENDDTVAPDGLVLQCQLDREMALIYFPIFALRYTFREQHQTVIACGVTGRIFGMAPGDVRESLRGQLAADGLDLRSPNGAPPDPLGCPECGRHLEASENALHHACLCGRDWAIDEAGVRQVTCLHVPGDGEPLPFWRFDLLLDRNGRSIERHAFVPAFEPCPPGLFRRLAVGLTALEPEYETGTGAAVTERTWPCRLPMSEARRTMAVLTGELWENSELGEIVDVALVWIPFESQAGYLVDPVTGVQMPDGSQNPEDGLAA